MSFVSEEVIQFKFHWVDDDGNDTGFLRKKGSFDGETLLLEDVEIPVVVILQVEAREKWMLIAAMGEDDETVHMTINTSAGIVSRLKSALDIARSKQWAEAHQENLRDEGRSGTYRDERCPQCGATVILSDMPRTPQLYCHFCDTLLTLNPSQAVPGERAYKICDECGMFSKPVKFTIFYFYFLLFFYGWSQRTTWRCPPCMRGEAWKMVFGNLIFVLGFPVAIVQLIRSYGGSIAGPFTGLNQGNVKACKGDLLGAFDLYDQIAQRVPDSAGVKYNLGMALVLQNKTEHAAATFRAALDDCSNYSPAYQGLVQCYEELGETEKLAELNRIWGTDEEDEQNQEETQYNAPE